MDSCNAGTYLLDPVIHKPGSGRWRMVEILSASSKLGEGAGRLDLHLGGGLGHHQVEERVGWLE